MCRKLKLNHFEPHSVHSHYVMETKTHDVMGYEDR